MMEKLQKRRVYSLPHKKTAFYSMMFLYGLLYKRFELEVLKHFYVEIFELFRLKTVFFVILSKVLKPHVKLIFYKVSFVVG